MILALRSSPFHVNGPIEMFWMPQATQAASASGSWFQFPSEYITAFSNSFLWSLLSFKLQFKHLHSLTWVFEYQNVDFWSLWGGGGGVQPPVTGLIKRIIIDLFIVKYLMHQGLEC